MIRTLCAASLLAVASLASLLPATTRAADCRNCGRPAQAAGTCQNGQCQQHRHGLCREDCPNCRPHQYGQPDLFYNFYAADCQGAAAQLYIAPQPVPAHVGHTFYTYQPLMPHEMLYRHHRNYHHYYHNGRGLTRTSIKWW